MAVRKSILSLEQAQAFITLHDELVAQGYEPRHHINELRHAANAWDKTEPEVKRWIMFLELHNKARFIDYYVKRNYLSFTEYECAGIRSFARSYRISLDEAALCFRCERKALTIAPDFELRYPKVAPLIPEAQILSYLDLHTAKNGKVYPLVPDALPLSAAQALCRAYAHHDANLEAIAQGLELAVSSAQLQRWALFYELYGATAFIDYYVLHQVQPYSDADYERIWAYAIEYCPDELERACIVYRCAYYKLARVFDRYRSKYAPTPQVEPLPRCEQVISFERRQGPIKSQVPSANATTSNAPNGPCQQFMSAVGAISLGPKKSMFLCLAMDCWNFEIRAFALSAESAPAAIGSTFKQLIKLIPAGQGCTVITNPTKDFTHPTIAQVLAPYPQVQHIFAQKESRYSTARVRTFFATLKRNGICYPYIRSPQELSEFIVSNIELHNKGSEIKELKGLSPLRYAEIYGPKQHVQSGD